MTIVPYSMSKSRPYSVLCSRTVIASSPVRRHAVVPEPVVAAIVVPEPVLADLFLDEPFVDEDEAFSGQPFVPEVLRLWGRLGPPLTVVTRGGRGAVVALSITGELTSVDAPPVVVVDTVGAGDSFMAGLLSGLMDAGLLGGVEARERLRSASLAAVRPAVDRALTCAAVTVSRAGANPPRREELQERDAGHL